MAEKMYNVKNRSTGITIYSIPEIPVRREFAPGQTLKISHSELEKLQYQPGGQTLIQEYLLIEGIKDFDIDTEPEYNMSEKDVINLIENGSIDEFLDTLDFAPAGVIDLIKVFAVSLPMNDANKRAALKEKTGYDIEAAIRHNQEDAAEEGADKPAPKKTRRVKKDGETSSNSGRRTTPKQYKVISDEQ